MSGVNRANVDNSSLVNFIVKVKPVEPLLTLSKDEEYVETC